MKDRVYVELTDPVQRAVVIAHTIRVCGKAPVIGECIGFSAQLKQIETPDLTTAIDHLNQAENQTEKIWCSLTVTEEDLEAGLNLLRSEKFTGRPGMVSHFKLS